MLSLRVLLVCAAVSTAIALPTDKPLPKPITSISDDDISESWFSFPIFHNFFAPLWRLFPSFADIGPKIVADDKKFQIIVNVKDYKKEDLKVKVKGDFVFVQGTQEEKKDDRDVFASQFFHTYTLPVNSSSAEVTAELSSNGYLLVTAPFNPAGERLKAEREVPIVETGVAYKKEEATKPELENETKKEPTTPSDIDVTEKDNIIPHGNEVSP